MLGKNLIKAAAAKAQPLYIEDTFQTHLYTGNSSTQTITNGIDLAGEGGLVWIKNRSYNPPRDHILFDSERDLNKRLILPRTDGEQTGGASATLTFNSDGFSVPSGDGDLNGNGFGDYASWTFRKAEKFFDVVTYTGDGVAGRTVAHNLGSVPGCIIVKKISATDSWYVYHRSLGETKYGLLNTTQIPGTFPAVWNNTPPTDSVFSLGADGGVNQSGATYVAYLFAHDAGGFGDDGTESVIKCGSYTGTSLVNLGWEPQWILTKKVTNNNGVLRDWMITDVMRGLKTTGQYANGLFPSTSGAETANNEGVYINSTGFTTEFDRAGTPGETYIYIAIRRGPMKTPTSGAEVFKTEAVASDANNITTGFPVDVAFDLTRVGGNMWTVSRLTGSYGLRTNADTAEFAAFGTWWDSNTIMKGLGATNQAAAYELFRRAPGFFDVVAYTGTGVARTVSHNLGVVPELMIVKRRDLTSSWNVYTATLGATKHIDLDTASSFSTNTFTWNNTAPTSSVFTVGSNNSASSGFYIAYLFATCPGVSKVGSYTGTGTTLDIDCGFTAGARFVLIKRTDSNGDWYVWDTARGIFSGLDPYLLLNSTAAEVTSTDYIDPLSSGFQISSTAPAAINALGGSYIYFSVA